MCIYIGIAISGFGGREGERGRRGGVKNYFYEIRAEMQ